MLSQNNYPESITDKTLETTEQTKIKISPLIFAMMIFANINQNGGIYNNYGSN